ncbi:MAG: hypothetical protein KJ954_14175 [Alphaproteobacteria bacterium]|nr:hypothetical protein [Alphaproteobacteria bacterium]
MIQPYTFLLALMGPVLVWIYKTRKADVAPGDVIWRGPAQWKTFANVVLLAGMSFFTPPDYLDSIVRASIGGPEIGWAVPILFGAVSEAAMLKVFVRPGRTWTTTPKARS